MSGDLVKRLRKGCIYDEADLSWCADVNEIGTDALCIEAADMIEELEAIVAQMGRVIDKMEKRNERNLIAVMVFTILALVLLLPVLGAYMEMNMERRLEHELKITCTKAGKNLIEGICIGGETK